VPVFISQVALLHADGFPIVGNLTGLLWSQILMFVFVSVPVVALAAVTPGLASLSAASIIAVALWRLLQQFRLTPWVRQFSDPDFLYSRTVPEEAQWVRYLVLGLAISAAALVAIYLQFKSRRTPLSRALLITIGFLGLQAHSFFAGPGFRWKVQVRASQQFLNTTAWRFSVGDPHPRDEAGTLVRLSMFVRNVPPGLDVDVKRSSFVLRTSDGKSFGDVWTTSKSLEESITGTNLREIRLDLFMPGPLFDNLKTDDVSLRGSLDLVVFGNERTVTIPAASFPANVTDSFRCTRRDPKPGGHPDRFPMTCRAALRWPRHSVSGAVSAVPDSFSPFPADLRLDPIRDKGLMGGVSGIVDPLRFTVKEPVSYARVTFEIPNVLRRGVQ
jgi:hypothetical protein